jgi:hypothetical protein
MKCPEIIYDKRIKNFRPCNAEIYGMTGLQEAEKFQKHLRKHQVYTSLIGAVEKRAESGQ